MMNSWRVIAFDMGGFCSLQNRKQDRRDWPLFLRELPCQFHKRCWRKLFWAQLQGGFINSVDGESSSAQGISQRFAPLVECSVGEAFEVGIANIRRPLLSPAEPQYPAVHLGRRIKDLRRNGK